MARYCLTVQYKGTNYLGWQIQPQGPTIQSVLEEKISKILNVKTHVRGSGRTDAGVHALAQTCHFDCQTLKRPSHFLYGLNSILPPDLVGLSLKKVADDFHAQRSARGKVYEYFVLNEPFPSPFLEEGAWRIPYAIKISPMRQAAKVLVGMHDFSSFCASQTDVKDKVRKVKKIKITSFKMGNPYPLAKAQGSKGLHVICFRFEGNGFLKHMVRNMVGTLIKVGLGKITAEEVKKILKAKDRTQAGMAAPAKGLVLKKVIY